MTCKLPLYLENLKVLRSPRWNFWGIGDLYLSVVRRGGMMIGLPERWSCQLHFGPQTFSLSILSLIGTWALHEYVRYWNIHPYIDIFFNISHIEKLSLCRRLFFQECFILYSFPEKSHIQTSMLESSPLTKDFFLVWLRRRILLSDFEKRNYTILL